MKKIDAIIKLPPTVEIFRAVLVMNVRLPEWEEQPTKPKVLYHPENWLTIACGVVELCRSVLTTKSVWELNKRLFVSSWTNKLSNAFWSVWLIGITLPPDEPFEASFVRWISSPRFPSEVKSIDHLRADISFALKPALTDNKKIARFLIPFLFESK